MQTMFLLPSKVVQRGNRYLGQVDKRLVKEATDSDKSAKEVQSLMTESERDIVLKIRLI